MYSKLAVWLKIVPTLLLLFSFTGRITAQNISETVDIDVYETGNNSPVDSVSFGFTTAGRTDSVVIPPENPGDLTEPHIYFRRTDWPGESGGTITVDLEKDYRTTNATTEDWALRVDIPVGYSKLLYADFDATVFKQGGSQNIGLVTITGGAYANKTISDKAYTGADRLLLIANTQYTISYTKVISGDLTVNVAPSDIGAQWRLKSGNGTWLDAGSVTVATGNSETIEFKPVAGYDTPLDKSFTMGGEGYQYTGTYLKQQAKSFVVNYLFEDENGNSVSAPPTVLSTRWKLKNSTANTYHQEDNLTEFSSAKVLTEVPNGTYNVEPADIVDLAEAWTIPTTFDDEDDLQVGVSSQAVISKDIVYTFIPAEASVSTNSIKMLDDGDVKKFIFSMNEKPTDDMTVNIAIPTAKSGAVSLSGTGITGSGDAYSFPVAKSESFPFSREITVTSTNITNHSSFDMTLTVNGPAQDSSPDPRYDGVQKVVAVEVYDEDVSSGGADLTVVPGSGIDLGKVKIGDELTAVILVENGDSLAENNVKAVTTDVTGQLILDDLVDLEGSSTGSFIFQFKAVKTGVLDGAEILILATERSGDPVVVKVPVSVEVTTATGNALTFDPDVIAARPEDGASVSVDFDVTAHIGNANSTSLTATFTVPAEMTGVTFSNVLGGVDPTTSDNLTYTFTYDTQIAKDTKQKLFTVTANVNTSTAGVVKEITSTLVVNSAAGAAQKAQLAIDNSVQLATMDVNGDGKYTKRDVILVLRSLPRPSGGLGQTGNNIFPEGAPQAGDNVNSVELTKNIESLLAILDVNKDLSQTKRDLILILRYLPRPSGGLAQTGDNIFPEGAAQSADNVTAGSLEENILKTLK